MAKTNAFCQLVDEYANADAQTEQLETDLNLSELLRVPQEEIHQGPPLFLIHSVEEIQVDE